MIKYTIRLAAVVLVIAPVTPAYAQGVVSPVSSPISHPVVQTIPIRTAGTWRHTLGRFGESLAYASLKMRGYEVYDLKISGNRGIDLVAIKRAADGTIEDVRLIEVKTHYGNGKPSLSQTKVGTQMSRDWLADRLRALRASGEEGRRLALEISRFRRANGIPIEQLGEVHDINLKTGTYTVRNPLTMAERAGPISIDRLLNQIGTHSALPEYQKWAIQHLSQYDQLRQVRMSNWLSGNPSTRALEQVSKTQLALVEEKQALRGASRGFLRAAGPLAIAATTTLESYYIYLDVTNYQSGKISQRELIISLARTVGGIAGAWAGAKSGAALGAWLGSYGGPYAWATVPLGGFVGGLAGGIAGYFAGSNLAESATHAWYNKLDRKLHEQISEWIKKTPLPADK